MIEIAKRDGLLGHEAVGIEQAPSRAWLVALTCQDLQRLQGLSGVSNLLVSDRHALTKQAKLPDVRRSLPILHRLFGIGSRGLEFAELRAGLASAVVETGEAARPAPAGGGASAPARRLRAVSGLGFC